MLFYNQIKEIVKSRTNVTYKRYCDLVDLLSVPEQHGTKLVNDIASAVTQVLEDDPTILQNLRMYSGKTGAHSISFPNTDGVQYNEQSPRDVVDSALNSHAVGHKDFLPINRWKKATVLLVGMDKKERAVPVLFHINDVKHMVDFYHTSLLGSMKNEMASPLSRLVCYKGYYVADRMFGFKEKNSFVFDNAWTRACPDLNVFQLQNMARAMALQVIDVERAVCDAVRNSISNNAYLFEEMA